MTIYTQIVDMSVSVPAIILPPDGRPQGDHTLGIVILVDRTGVCLVEVVTLDCEVHKPEMAEMPNADERTVRNTTGRVKRSPSAVMAM